MFIRGLGDDNSAYWLYHRILAQYRLTFSKLNIDLLLAHKCNFGSSMSLSDCLEPLNNISLREQLALSGQFGGYLV